MDLLDGRCGRLVPSVCGWNEDDDNVAPLATLRSWRKEWAGVRPTRKKRRDVEHVDVMTLDVTFLGITTNRYKL